MKLTQAELAYFETFGYLCLPGCLSNEIEDITRRFEKMWDAHGGGHFGQAHDGKQRSALLPFIDIDEYLSSLIDHPRLDGIASSILGDDYNYTSSDGNFYVGDTGWHSDGYGLSKYTSIKMAMYLDPVGSESGCLRVIPGSHHVGDSFGDVLNKAVPSSKKANYEEIWGVTGRDIPSVHLNSKPGDLVVFNHSLKHASFGGGDKRRMFTINYQKRHDDKDIYDYEGIWSEHYNSVYIGRIRLKNGYVFRSNPSFIVKQAKQCIPLSMHFTDNKTFKRTWDPIYNNYYIQ